MSSIAAVRSTLMQTGGGAKDVRKFVRKLPKANRAALERTFKYWLKNFAPKHFKRVAFRRYPDAYDSHWKSDMRMGRWAKQIEFKMKQGKETDMPLVATGRMREAFLNGTYLFGGDNERLIVRWPALPPYAYQYLTGKKKAGRQGMRKSIDKAKAMTVTNESEDAALARQFNKFYQMEIGKIDPTSKSFGQAVM